MMRSRRALFAALAALVALAAGLGASVEVLRRTTPPETPQIGGGYVLDDPREVPAFDLVDSRGQPFHIEDFKGHWSLLYFGYTYCPDICPVAMLELAGAKEKLEGAADKAYADAVSDLEYFLVSVDPARDTPERIGEYVEYFDPAFRGLTGDIAEIDKLAKAAAVVYVIPDAKKGEPYVVGHSSTVTLIDPKGRIYAIFTEPLEADSLAAGFSKIVARYDPPAATD
jgi:protein SCO1/2